MNTMMMMMMMMILQSMSVRPQMFGSPARSLAYSFEIVALRPVISKGFVVSISATRKTFVLYLVALHIIAYFFTQITGTNSKK
jgi:hypothetical protein